MVYAVDVFNDNIIRCSFIALFAIGKINSIASKYYNVSPDIISWLGNSFMLINVLTALPFANFMT